MWATAKYEAEMEVNLVLQQWKKPITIEKCFSVLSHGELSFLDLQEDGGVDGQGMALDVLFSWISTYFSSKTATKAIDHDLGFV